MQINDDDDDDDDMEQFHHFGTVFAKEDCETRKVVQKPCLFMRQSRSVQLDSRTASATLSRDKVAHSCDKIAGVTSVSVGGRH